MVQTLSRQTRTALAEGSYDEVLELLPDAELAHLFVAAEGEGAGQVKDYLAVRPPNDLNNVYAIVSKQYQLIRHREVCERVFETFDKIGTVELRPSLQLTNNGAQMKLTFRFGDRVAIGEKDWLEPTLTIFNSYDLSMNLSLEVGAKRLVCLNGLMAYSRFAGGRHKHVGKVRNLIDSSDVSRQIGHFIENVVPLWRKSAEFELSLDEADGVFKYAHEKVGMPITLIDAAQKVWKGRAAMDEVERPSTAWILYNTLTNVITHQRGMNLRKEMALARQKALQEQSFKLLSDIVEGGRV